MNASERTKLHVFVSADMHELGAERATAADAIASMRLVPVLSETSPIDAGRCDLFLGIYGGSSGLSNVTKIAAEYDDSARLPKLIYVQDIDERDEALRAFLKRIQIDDQVSYKHFRSLDELRELVQEDLALTLAERYAGTTEKSVVTGASHIPKPLTPLIGREAEVARVRALIRDGGARLVTLLGTGGIGKTRVAIEATAGLADAFPGGMHHVALAPVKDPGLVLPTIARAFGVRHGAGSVQDAIVTSLRDRRTLVLLDNFEHVLPASAEVGELLMSAPDLSILVTSRAALSLRGENTIEIAPLDVSAEGWNDELCAAVRLFVSRAGEVRPDLVWDDATLDIVTRICRRLDGLPLAIELAAARVRVLKPDALLERLSTSSDLLSSRSSDVPDRQRTLEQTIDWSYQLLTEEERKAFEGLSVYPSFFTIDDAEAVLDKDVDAVTVLASLLDQSLVRRIDLRASRSWFGMLETLRQFGAARLEERGAVDEIRKRHALWMARVVEMAAPELRGRKQRSWLERADYGRHNLRTALDWSRSNDVGTLVKIVLGATFFWEVRGYLAEGRGWCEVGLELCPVHDTISRAALHRGAGRLARAQGDLEAAGMHHKEGLELAQRGSDRALEALLMKDLGVVALETGDLERAHELFDQALAMAREAGDLVCVAETLNNLGVVQRFEGDPEASKSALERSLEAFRRLGDEQGVARALMNLGTAHRGLSRFDEAIDLYKKSLVEWQKVGGRWMLAECVEQIALVAAYRDDIDRAGVLLGAAERMREIIGAPWSGSEHDLMTEYVAKVQASLRERGRMDLWDEGRRLDLDAAVEYALAI